MAQIDTQVLVERHYQALYRFALSLSRSESDASDLTQQTFYLWAAKGHQLRDQTKAKTWLFTTLYREFLAIRRRAERHPHEEMNEDHHAAPEISAEAANKFDSTVVQKALSQLNEKYAPALTLFYLKDHSYKQISEVLGIPIGTVMSRLCRGKQELRKLLVDTGDMITLKGETPEGES